MPDANLSDAKARHSATLCGFAVFVHSSGEQNRSEWCPMKKASGISNYHLVNVKVCPNGEITHNIALLSDAVFTQEP